MAEPKAFAPEVDIEELASIRERHAAATPASMPVQAWLDIASLLALIDQQATALRAIDEARKGAEARIKELSDALGPFATYIATRENMLAEREHDDERMLRGVTIGDFRRARSALLPSLPAEQGDGADGGFDHADAAVACRETAAELMATPDRDCNIVSQAQYWNRKADEHDALAKPASSPVGGDAVRGIYIASKATHGERWRDLRASGVPIMSTWIDEAEAGATINWPDLWHRCVREASQAAATIVYREQGQVLKGAFVEMGAALAAGRIVFAVGCDEFSVRHHMRVVLCSSLEEALELAHEHIAYLAALSPSLPAKEDASAKAVGDEREACAKLAENLPGQQGNSPEHLVGRRIAAAIRARTATPEKEESQW